MENVLLGVRFAGEFDGMSLGVWTRARTGRRWSQPGSAPSSSRLST